ncbi:Flp pilus assembly protein CpaB [Novosphingobium bradum]|uniref:Flp pilus assembly protein CpaB n=1 Tax=Novosphingobium bradum TaxID=1737444 RepID=A0ABV7IMW7_9SPHN
MQKRNLILLAVAVLIGVFAVVLANAWFSGMETRQQGTVRQQETARIVVAAAPLDFGASLNSTNVRLQDWPAASVPEGAFRTVPDALKNERVVLRPLVAGEPLLASNVSGANGRATLAALLPQGMRAISIAVNDVRGVSGFVLPGTLVDVLLTRQIDGGGAQNNDMRSDVVLKGVRVLAIDQLASDRQNEPKVARTATLAVSLRDAQRLAIAEKIGSLSLALRRLEDGVADVGSGTQLVTSRDVAGPRIAIPARQAAAAGIAAQSYRAESYRAESYRAGGIMPPALPSIGGAAAITPVRAGPILTVVRGVEPTDYPVGQALGR